MYNCWKKVTRFSFEQYPEQIVYHKVPLDDQDIAEFRQDLLDNAIFDTESLIGIEFGIKGAKDDLGNVLFLKYCF